MWTDELGRDWSTAINVNTVRRVKDMTGVLLTDAADTDLVQQLYNNVMLLCDVLYAVSKPQADERQIDSASFGEALVGDFIDKACESLMQDIVRFFPSGRREGVRKIWTAARKLEEQRMNLIQQKMTDEQLEMMILDAAKKAGDEIDRRLAELGDSSGKSPAQSELTQDN